MYNSLVVRFLVRIWDGFIFGYNNSFIKKIAHFIKVIISYLFFGSITKDIFTSQKSIIEMSIFYKIYVNFLNAISKIIKSINNYMKSIGNNSVIYKSVTNLFKDNSEVASSIFSFILFFGIGIIINNIARGLFSGRSYIVATGLIIISAFTIALKGKYKEILGNSLVYKFIISLFTIDEGGANWW